MKTNVQLSSAGAIMVAFLLMVFLPAVPVKVIKAQDTKPGSSNFFSIQKECNEYWKDREVTRGCGYKPFKRWEWFWEQRVGRDGVFPPGDVRLRAWEQYVSENPEDSPLDTTANWTGMGPYTTTSGYAGLGRINCIAFHPTNKDIFWVGTPSGGIWKTTNFGQSWTTYSGTLPVLGVSDIVVHPTNPNLIYIATGDGDAGSLTGTQGMSGGDNSSAGVWKSIDGGNTWNPTGLTWNISEQVLIRRIIMHPTKDSVLYAATTKGIYKTSDYGVNWNLQQAGEFTDIAFNTLNREILYAATQGKLNSQGNLSVSGQIWRTPDGGSSWSPVTTFNGALRIVLAVTPQQSNLVEAIAANVSGGLWGIYRSTDGGQSFAEFFNPKSNCRDNLLNSYRYPHSKPGPCGGQGAYDLCYMINPNNVSERWLGGVNTWKSSNSGASWTLSNYWDGDSAQYKTVHADKHWFAFHPLQQGTFFEANDGGIYYTTDGGSNWTDISNTLQIGQIYRIASAYTDPNIISGGFQDNGSQVDSAGNWRAPTVIGGDGMMCRIDYGNANIKYASYAEGVIYRTTSPTWSNTVTISDTIPGKPKGSWVTPFVIHPSNPATLYAGYRNIFRTINRGNTWVKVSSFGTANPEDDTLIRTIAISRSRPQTQYAATKFSLFKTTNGWFAHTMIDAGLPVDSCVITSIAVHPNKPDTVYVTFSGYKSGKKVYRTYNGGSSWNNISLNLPNIPVNCIVYQDSADEAVYVGTDLGVWFTNANMTNWKRFSHGLPNVVVTDLDIHYMNNKIRAATYGRGLWESRMYIASGNRQVNAIDLPVVGGDVMGDGVFTPGETATLTADPEPGWDFEGWYESGIKVSGDSVYSFVVSESRNLVGLFVTENAVQELKKYDISIYPNPSSGLVDVKSERSLLNALRSVTVSDMTGRIVFRTELREATDRIVLDLRANAAGNYLLTFCLETGEYVSCSLVIRK